MFFITKVWPEGLDYKSVTKLVEIGTQASIRPSGGSTELPTDESATASLVPAWSIAASLGEYIVKDRET